MHPSKVDIHSGEAHASSQAAADIELAESHGNDTAKFHDRSTGATIAHNATTETDTTNGSSPTSHKSPSTSHHFLDPPLTGIASPNMNDNKDNDSNNGIENNEDKNDGNNKFCANTYASKKSTIQGLLSASVLSTNIASLIDIYRQQTYGPPTTIIQFFTPSVVFLVTSILVETLNIVFSAVLVLGYNINDPEQIPRSNLLTNLSIGLSSLSMVLNFITSALLKTSVGTDSDAGMITMITNATRY